MSPRIAWAILLAGIACVLVPKASVRVAPPERAVAIVLRGPSLEQLGAAGILSRMEASPRPWAASELSLIPGAAGHLLWRRIETGMIRPTPSSPDFASLGLDVRGSWSALPDAAADQKQFDAIEAREPSLLEASVVIVSCSAAGDALVDGACRSVIERGIALAETMSATGGTGVVLSVPPSGAPARGAVWVASDHLKSAPRFRFREIDLLPLLLYLRGDALPASLEGVPGIDLLSGEFMFHRPVRFAGGGNG